MDMNKLLNPRILELMQADEEGRVIILPDSAEEQLFGVQNALGIRLYGWQIAYIWGKSHYLMPGRATGKTFAQIIKLCVSEGCPIILPINRQPNVDGLGTPESYENYRWFRSEVERIYRRLEAYEVPGLRKIYFSDKEAHADGFNLWRF